jgi:hypothetical protein
MDRKSAAALGRLSQSLKAVERERRMKQALRENWWTVPALCVAFAVTKPAVFKVPADLREEGELEQRQHPLRGRGRPLNEYRIRREALSPGETGGR